MHIKIGFTGTRNGMDPDQKAAVHFLLLELAAEGVQFEVHHGDCVGADEEFHSLVAGQATKIVVHPPEDKKLRAYCPGDVILKPLPYAMRNYNIVEAATHVIGAPATLTPKGGTWQTIQFAKDKGNLWRIVFPHGLVVNG